MVFLTTLSVYLGLVLVGATPPVMAHAALTQRIEIQNEIETDDDLDKNPDDEQSLETYSSAFQSLFTLAKEFSEKNREKLGGNAYEFNCSVVFRADSSNTVTFTGGGGLFWGGFLSPLKNIGKAFPHTSDEKTEQVKINLVLSDTQFSLKTAFNYDSDLQAENSHRFYENGLSRLKVQKLNNPQIVIYQNTEILAENNQVFIITRLPRASIDALLAERVAK
jgi:hypothetical protein